MLKETEAEEFCLLVNYEAWSRNRKLLDTFESMQFDTVVCDEAHRVKETKTSAYQGVEQIVTARNTCQDCDGWCAKGRCFGEMCTYPNPIPSVKNLLLLTGTPILNRPTEIYPLLHLVHPEIFQSEKNFLRLFCFQPDAWNDPNKWIFQEGGLERLADKIQGFYIRRTLSDTNIVLPPQDVRVHELEMTEEDYPLQCEIYRQLAQHAQVMIDDNPAMDMMSQLALITRLRQAVVWPGGIKLKVPQRWPDGSPVYDFEGNPVFKDENVGEHFKESVKLDRTIEMLQEYVSEGKRIVVFSQFAEVIRELLRRCEHVGIRAAGYYGDTSQMDRIAIKSNFDRNVGEEPKWDVVICHYTTGGVGLNFTAATRMILTDEEWNPGKEDQAMKRISRIGQTENTIIDILRVENSIDTWLAGLIEDKRSLITEFNDQNEIYKEIRMMLMKGFIKNDE
jgi:SNF2 family DNA or RNA helicase